MSITSKYRQCFLTYIRHLDETINGLEITLIDPKIQDVFVKQTIIGSKEMDMLKIMYPL